MPAHIPWPEKRRFAFSVFDDPDGQTPETTEAVYGFLAGAGFRTTKGVWPLAPTRTPSDLGATCGDALYEQLVLRLQAAGFEIGFHNATSHTSGRDETIRGIEAFARLFGSYPATMANHYFCQEDMYWGDDRLSGWNRAIYNFATLGKNRRCSFGHVPDHPCFWGDVCRERIKYVRNFVFPQLNTLKACPWMPYHDPARPFVNLWFAASDGANVRLFNKRLSEANQEKLEEEGGACIMYAHFGHGFYRDGKLDAHFRSLIERLGRRNGWFVPVATLLDFLLDHRGRTVLTNARRSELERRWLWYKLRSGTS